MLLSWDKSNNQSNSNSWGFFVRVDCLNIIFREVNALKRIRVAAKTTKTEAKRELKGMWRQQKPTRRLLMHLKKVSTSPKKYVNNINVNYNFV